jgi:multidrug efflux pump subunit AcrA (membrane-fusion protein)
LRLTHEDLVEKQSELLRDLQQLDVVRREVARLEEVTESGAVAGKTLLERNYEQQKLEAAVNAAVQGLRLHGLSEPQIESIVEQRQLLESVEIVAPASGEAHAGDDHQGFLQFTEVLVRQGDHVTAGTPLGVLSDHCQLYLEGLAFEQDSPLLNRLANEGVALSAVVDANGPAERVIGDLRVLYVENQVELESRALRFYVPLANELVRNETTPDGHRFIGWRFRPGQRVELRLPVETWKGRLVLPAEAVVREGAESYVFQQNDGHFDRLNVHLLHSDSHWAVIEPDGVLAPGDLVAGKGAYQLHLALKNRSGAGIDPHAGHGH